METLSRKLQPRANIPSLNLVFYSLPCSAALLQVQSSTSSSQVYHMCHMIYHVASTQAHSCDESYVVIYVWNHHSLETLESRVLLHNGRSIGSCAFHLLFKTWSAQLYPDSTKISFLTSISTVGHHFVTIKGELRRFVGKRNPANFKKCIPSLNWWVWGRSPQILLK